MKFIYLFIITLIISCGRIPEPIPEWVTQSESNSKYWIGVGSAKDRDSAINSAMNSIASQISLQIESKMTNLKIEKNNEIINYTRNIIETRVNIYLPQVEMQKVVLHNKTWYALVELNKENYYFQLATKRENARQAAVQLISQNLDSSIIDRMKALYSAWEQIMPYLDVPITANINGKQNVNIYAEIQNQFRKLIVGINISLIKPIPELTCVLPLEQAVEFSVSSYDGQSVAGVPFEISLSSGLITEFAVVENGYLKLIIDQISPGYTSGLLKAELKIEDIFNTDQLPSFFNFDKSISIPVASKPLKVFINGEEFNLGKKSELPIILPVLSDHFLKKYNAVKVRYKEESDIAISIKSESKKGNIAENEWGIYKAFSECILMVTLTAEDLNLYMGTLHHVQAGDFTSHQSAGSKALKNLTIEIINTLLPEMDNILLKI